LAELARGKLRKNLPALRQALVGRFRGHHAVLVDQVLAHLDDLAEAIDTVSTQIDTLHRAQRNPMCRCPTAGLREKPARNVTLSRSGAESKT
jgi:hypothetical protein